MSSELKLQFSSLVTESRRVRAPALGARDRNAMALWLLPQRRFRDLVNGLSRGEEARKSATAADDNVELREMEHTTRARKQIRPEMAGCVSCCDPKVTAAAV